MPVRKRNVKPRPSRQRIKENIAEKRRRNIRRETKIAQISKKKKDNQQKKTKNNENMQLRGGNFWHVLCSDDFEPRGKKRRKHFFILNGSTNDGFN